MFELDYLEFEEATEEISATESFVETQEIVENVVRKDFPESWIYQNFNRLVLAVMLLLNSRNRKILHLIALRFWLFY